MYRRVSSDRVADRAHEIAAMTDLPITLDDRRTTAGKLEILTRGRAANTRSMPETFGDPVNTELSLAMSAGPAGTRTEAADKAGFLLERLSALPETPNARIRKLNARAMCDLTRLKKQEENAP